MRPPTIVLDPGHGGTAATDLFRQGPRGEREEWINLRVCLLLKDILERKHLHVLLTRSHDVAVSLQDRVDLATESQAQLFVSVHHASCQPVIESINFPFLFIHEGLNTNKKVDLARCFQKEMSKLDHGPALIFSDLWVFDDGLFILRKLDPLNIPSLITEFSFFSHPGEELRLSQKERCWQEAQSLAQAIETFLSNNPQQKEIVRVSQNDFPKVYRKQLEVIKKSTLETFNIKSNFWHKLLQDGDLFFQEQDWQQATVHYEQALSVNPYFPQIKSVLAKMVHCTQKLGADEYRANLEKLANHVW